jgi:drug/metabolite transporter (DMT)-like permease
VFGIWIWGEHPTALSIAGMMLVTMGGVVSAWSRRPAELRR